MTDRPAAARVVHTALAVVVVLSVLTELGRAISGANVLVPADDPGAGRGCCACFSYFTIQSDLLVLAASCR